MKKLATLILAAGLVFGAATGASAIDFKAKGQWIVAFEYGQNGNFQGKYDGHKNSGWNSKQDEFEASQRFRIGLDAVASETLSGTLYFEIGQNFWGKASNGMALGGDGTTVKVKHAYIDWMVPETALKVRMGLQGVALPSFTIGSSTVMDDDVAAVVANYAVNENIGITALWMRPFNDNWGGNDNTPYASYSPANYLDNADFGALLIPLTFDGIKATPWGMYGAIGPNTFRAFTKDSYKVDKNGNNVVLVPGTNNYLGNTAPAGSADSWFQKGMFPVAGASHKNEIGGANGKKKLTSYGQAWWLGATGEFTIWDPFRIAWDFTYGSVTWEDDGRLNRQGWLASLLVEYKMDWGIPGIYGWYGSGDDNNPSNGSERLPTVSANNTNGFSNFAFTGASHIARDGVIGGNMGGTWGVGARVKDMSFIEDLKHTFRVNLIGGTNSPSMAKKMSLAGLWFNGSDLDDGKISTIGMDSVYLTTKDYALELGLTSTYKMYDNFSIILDMSYLAMWLDTGKDVWGARHRNGESIPQTKDAWDISAQFAYTF